jgi:hypothetical protein
VFSFRPLGCVHYLKPVSRDRLTSARMMAMADDPIAYAAFCMN